MARAPRVEWDSRRILAQALAAGIDAVDAAAARAVPIAASLSRYDTGRYSRGWEVIPATAYEAVVRGGIANAVPYAPYVHNGTSRMTGDFAGLRAADAISGELPLIVSSRLVFW